MANRRGKGGSSDRFPLLGLQNHCGLWLQPQNQKVIASWQESDDKPRECVLKSRDITLLTKVSIVKAMAFPMVTYSCESRTIKKAEHQRIDTFKLWCWRRLLKVPWLARKSNQSILRTDAETETPVFWSPEANSRLIGKVPDAGKYQGQKEKGMSKDEMAGWHEHEHELGQTSGDCEGQGGVASCDSWGRKESDTTEWLNWLNWSLLLLTVAGMLDF